MKLVLSIGLCIMIQEISFKEKQQQFQRVRDAFKEKETTLHNAFKNAGLQYWNFQVFLRGIKDEGTLEVWIKPHGKSTFTLLKAYPFCATSGTLGPKRKEGDYQIPEGLYQINHFNPESNFHLSLGLDYPNASDKILSDKKKPGSAIYIHGNCVTIGCIPITDDLIKELYVLCVEAKSAGQQKIFVHVYPSRLNDEAFEKLKQQYASAPSTISYWENLKDIYQDFEKTKMLKSFTVDEKGRYKI